MQLLETGLLDRYGIKTVGVGVIPRVAPDAALSGVLAWKNSFAQRTNADLHIVTQFCFEAGPIIAWDKRLNAEGNVLPIRIGLPGLAKAKTLLN